MVYQLVCRGGAHVAHTVDTAGNKRRTSGIGEMETVAAEYQIAHRAHSHARYKEKDEVKNRHTRGNSEKQETDGGQREKYRVDLGLVSFELGEKVNADVCADDIYNGYRRRQK